MNPIQSHRGIRIDRIPVSGFAGLLFTLAALLIFLSLPAVRDFMLIGLAGGIPTAAALYYLHHQTRW
jgi:hypothetical protein